MFNSKQIIWGSQSIVTSWPIKAGERTNVDSHKPGPVIFQTCLNQFGHFPDGQRVKWQNQLDHCDLIVISVMKSMSSIGTAVSTPVSTFQNPYFSCSRLKEFIMK